MDCHAFEAKIDQYLDAVLSRSDMETAADHVHGCSGCNGLVTSYQHASALLRTAVADRAAAVDVSDLWTSIEARLDAEPGSLACPEPADGRERGRWRGRWMDLGRHVRDLVLGVLGPAPLRVGAFAAVAVALALFVVAGGPGIGPKIDSEIAQKKTETLTVISRRENRARSRDALVRHVRIDNVDIAPGNSVSIWSRPRTRTQVIWVDSSGDDFGVSNAAATDDTH